MKKKKRGRSKYEKENKEKKKRKEGAAETDGREEWSCATEGKGGKGKRE